MFQKSAVLLFAFLVFAQPIAAKPAKLSPVDFNDQTVRQETKKSYVASRIVILSIHDPLRLNIFAVDIAQRLPTLPEHDLVVMRYFLVCDNDQYKAEALSALGPGRVFNIVRNKARQIHLSNGENIRPSKLQHALHTHISYDMITTELERRAAKTANALLNDQRPTNSQNLPLLQ